MTTLQWDQVGQRRYEAGLDRGVLYIPSGAVPWNGLTSVEEQFGDEAENFSYDGVTYLNAPSTEEFAAVIRALTYPDEFLPYDGYAAINPGFYADNQSASSFNLSYRTGVGTDVADDAGYLIHLVYSLTVGPTDKARSSLTDSAEALEFEWNVTATAAPPISYTPAGGTAQTYRATAHIILDTTQLPAYYIKIVEDILYGTATTAPRMLTVSELLTYAANFGTIAIIDNGDGTWTAYGPDDRVIDNGDGSFTIIGVDSTVIDANTYTMSSTAL